MLPTVGDQEAAKKDTRVFTRLLALVHMAPVDSYVFCCPHWSKYVLLSLLFSIHVTDIKSHRQLSTEFDKTIYYIGLGADEANALTELDITKKRSTMVGFPHYGIVKNDFLMLKGSIPPSKECVITIRKSLMAHTSHRDLEKVQLKFIDASPKFGVSVQPVNCNMYVNCSCSRSIALAFPNV